MFDHSSNDLEKTKRKKKPNGYISNIFFSFKKIFFSTPFLYVKRNKKTKRTIRCSRRYRRKTNRNLRGATSERVSHWLMQLTNRKRVLIFIYFVCTIRYSINRSMMMDDENLVDHDTAKNMRTNGEEENCISSLPLSRRFFFERFI